MTITGGSRAVIVGGGDTHVGPVRSETLLKVIEHPPQIVARTEALSGEARVREELGELQFDVPVIRDLVPPLTFPGSELQKILATVVQEADDDPRD